MQLAVLASGSGTILQAMIDDVLPVGFVVTDRPCAAIDVATEAGIPAQVLDRREWGGFGSRFRRTEYTQALADLLSAHMPSIVAMAGFGTVLGEPMHRAFPGRILNTHPALLPAFPGWHGVEDALVAGVKVTGCTVHVAELVMDTGPILAQEAVDVLPDDTVETLHERIKGVERRLYPATIRRVLERETVSR